MRSLCNLACHRHQKAFRSMSRSSSMEVRAHSNSTSTHDVVVVGGGQAGLCASYYLKQLGREHVLLEKEQAVVPHWRNMWDSFTLVSANLAFRIPGAEDLDPEAFLKAAEVVAHFEQLANNNGLPVQTGVEVRKLSKHEGSHFVLETNAGTMNSHAVILATGPFPKPKVPQFAENINSGILQLHTSQYRSPSKLPPGAVLVVGAGQSGAQIAKELVLAGKDVYISAGDRCTAAPRRYRGRELGHWMVESGMTNMTIDKHPKGEAIRTFPNPALHSSGPVLLQQLGMQGAHIVGKVTGVEEDGNTLLLKDNVPAALQMVLAFHKQFTDIIDAHVAKNGLETAPPEQLPEEVIAWKPKECPEKLSLAKAGITSIIWATGYTRDYSWLDVPGFDPTCTYPKQHHGASEVPGLYFLGLHWMHTMGSGTFFGIADDAKHIAQQVDGFLQPNNMDGLPHKLQGSTAGVAQ